MTLERSIHNRQITKTDIKKAHTELKILPAYQEKGQRTVTYDAVIYYGIDTEARDIYVLLCVPQVYTHEQRLQAMVAFTNEQEGRTFENIPQAIGSVQLTFPNGDGQATRVKIHKSIDSHDALLKVFFEKAENYDFR